jgi:hypothetical protein
MAEPLDFRCGDCGALPGKPCVYIWPTNYPLHAVATLYFPKNGKSVNWRADKPVYAPAWNGYQPYTVQLEIWLRGMRAGEAHSFYQRLTLAEIREMLEDLGPKIKKVGTPTDRLHNARYNALWRWVQIQEVRCQQEYLREWLGEFGDIFTNRSSRALVVVAPRGLEVPAPAGLEGS